MKIINTASIWVTLEHGRTIGDVRQWLHRIEELGLEDDTPLQECSLSCELFTQNIHPILTDTGVSIVVDTEI